jgi:nitrate/nitrite transporter NarK
MVLVSWHSDKSGERQGHVGAVYLMSGVSLLLSISLRGQFWLSYVLLCLAIPAPFAALGPFWAIPSETLPRPAVGAVMGLVNAIGNVGGFAGNYAAGWLKMKYNSTAVAFGVLGGGLVVAAVLAFLLPKRRFGQELPRDQKMEPG